MQLLLVCLVAGAVMTATNMVSPLAPLDAAAFHAAPAVVGAIVGAGSFVPLLLAVPAGAFTDRVGAKRLLVPGLLAAVAGTGLAAAAPGLGMLTAGMVLLGLGQFGATLGVQALVANMPGRSRNDTFAVYAVAGAAGGLAGPVLAGVLADRIGIAGAFAWAAALTAAATVVALGIDARTAPGSGLRVRPRASVAAAARMVRTPAIGTAIGVTALILFADDVTASFYPVLLASQGVALGTIGVLISLRGVASLAVRPTIGRLTRRLDRWWLVAGAMALEAAGTLAVPLAPALAVQVPAALLCGVALGFNQPLSMAIVADHAPAGQRSTALAMRLAGNRVSLVASPLLLGLVVAGLGLPACFVVAGAAPLVGMAFVLRFQTRGGEVAAASSAAQSSR